MANLLWFKSTTIEEPLAKVPNVALPGLDPFSFGSRGRSPSINRQELPHKVLHCQLEGETPGEP
jgi:hypothetical protein